MLANASPGRRHESFLRPGHDDIDPPGIGLERHGTEARDRIDDGDHAGVVARGDERPDVGDDTRRRLRMHDERHSRATLGQQPGDVLGLRSLAPGVGQRHDIDPERRAQLLPPRPEFAVRDDERFLSRREQVHERRLERTRAGGGEEEHLVLRSEYLAQAGVGLLEHRLEVRRAMVDHRLGERRQHLGRHRRRSGSEEVALLRHRPQSLARASPTPDGCAHYALR